MLKYSSIPEKGKFLLLRLLHWFTNLKIKHILLTGLSGLILLGLCSYLIIGPRMLSQQMEGEINRHLDDLLNVTENTINETQHNMEVYARLMSRLIARTEGITNRSLWKKNGASPPEIASRLTYVLTDLLYQTGDSAPFSAEIILQRGLLDKGETLRPTGVIQKSKRLEKHLVFLIQNFISIGNTPLNSEILPNNDSLAIIATSPIKALDLRLAVVVLNTLDNDFITTLQKKTNEDIQFAIYKLDMQNNQTVSITSTITDANGAPVIGKSLPSGVVKSILTKQKEQKTYYLNKKLDGKDYRVGYKILTNNLGNVGVLEVAIPTDSIMQATALQKQRIYLVTLLGILLSLCLVWLILYSINIPLTQLIQGTETAAAGDFAQRIKIDTRNEIGYLAEKFNWMIENIQSKQKELLAKERLAAIGNFAASIIHDLKNPLTIILWYLELLKRDNITNEQKNDYVGFIVAEIHRLKEMTLEILDFIKGNINLDKKPCNITELLSDIFTTFEKSLAEKDIQMFLVQECSEKASVDIDRLRRVIYNLISNAVDALNPGGVLIMGTTVSNGYFEITISNTGKGISKKIIDRLFQPFISAKKKNGTGLGLSICQRIIQEHGGNIRVESKLGIGTTFIVKLPLETKTPAVL